MGFEAEKAYACAVLFGELLQLPYRLDFSPAATAYRLVLPGGRVLLLEEHFWKNVAPGEAYYQEKYLPQRVWTMPSPFERGQDVVGLWGRPLVEETAEGLRCGLDVLAATFFMLTRWEEVAITQRDAYGRFPAHASLAWRAGFLHRPIVNEYARFVAQALTRLGFNVPRPTASARIVLSCDVDHPRLWWSVVDRCRTLAGSLLQRRNLREARWWMRHHLLKKGDPFDIFDAWMSAAEHQGRVWHFNFMGGRSETKEAPYSLQHPFIAQLLQRIAQRGHVIGFHPSRRAYIDPVAFERELSALRRVALTPVQTGRQHYLCFSVPHTWQQWADAHMRWDSTLGYPETEGFRCGICSEFPVFNILTRQRLALREKPLIAMDVSFARYQKYTPAQAAERLQTLWKTVQEHRGELVVLWHNSSWNDFFWKDWQEVWLGLFR